MKPEPSDFADFRALAAALGKDPLVAQGAGGNVSIKHDGAMWVKASGAWLKYASLRNIFAVVDLGGVNLDGNSEPVFRQLDNEEKLRPSIETSLHAVLSHRIVVHVHSVQALALAVRRDAAKLCAEKLSGLKFAFVPYVKPGWPLTQALRKSIKSSVPDIFILGNHGLIVGGETVAQVKSRLAEVSSRLNTPARKAPDADIKYLEQVCEKGGWRLPRNASVHSLATDPVSRGYATGGTLYPDHVVFLGRGCRAVTIDKLAVIEPSKQPMILIEGKGVLLASGLSEAGEEMAECLAAVTARIPPEVELNYLSASDEDALLNWDAEKYRQAVK